jgi:hypothetical protein
VLLQRPSRRHVVPIAGSDPLGVALLAGLLLVLLGGFHALVAVTAIRGNHGPLVQHLGYAYQMDLTAWGWIHLGLGAAAVVIGAGVIAGQSWAYVLGLGVAFLSAIGSFAFLPQAPIWSILVIAFDGLVIWALVSELREPD